MYILHPTYVLGLLHSDLPVLTASRGPEPEAHAGDLASDARAHLMKAAARSTSTGEIHTYYMRFNAYSHPLRISAGGFQSTFPPWRSAAALESPRSCRGTCGLQVVRAVGTQKYIHTHTSMGSITSAPGQPYIIETSIHTHSARSAGRVGTRRSVWDSTSENRSPKPRPQQQCFSVSVTVHEDGSIGV